MSQHSHRRRKLSSIFLSLSALLIFTSLAFFIYADQYYPTDSDAITSIEQNSQIELTYNPKYLVLSPKENALDTGLIFYPGGKVEHNAYARLLSEITNEGYTCIIPKMPFNLAVFDQKAAADIIADLSSIHTWYIGGHSLGGAMAAIYASEKSDLLEGLILIGSYSTKDMSRLPIRTLSIYGSEDQVLNKSNYENNKNNLPLAATEFCITGGNHSFYGDYGMQKGDGMATISPEEQQHITAKAILEFMTAYT